MVEITVLFALYALYAATRLVVVGLVERGHAFVRTVKGLRDHREERASGLTPEEIRMLLRD